MDTSSKAGLARTTEPVRVPITLPTLTVQQYRAIWQRMVHRFGVSGYLRPTRLLGGMVPIAYADYDTDRWVVERHALIIGDVRTELRLCFTERGRFASLWQFAGDRWVECDPEGGHDYPEHRGLSESGMWTGVRGERPNEFAEAYDPRHDLWNPLTQQIVLDGATGKGVHRLPKHTLGGYRPRHDDEFVPDITDVLSAYDPMDHLPHAPLVVRSQVFHATSMVGGKPRRSRMVRLLGIDGSDTEDNVLYMVRYGEWLDEAESDQQYQARARRRAIDRAAGRPVGSRKHIIATLLWQAERVLERRLLDKRWYTVKGSDIKPIPSWDAVYKGPTTWVSDGTGRWVPQHRADRAAYWSAYHAHMGRDTVLPTPMSTPTWAFTPYIDHTDLHGLIYGRNVRTLPTPFTPGHAGQAGEIVRPEPDLVDRIYYTDGMRLGVEIDGAVVEIAPDQVRHVVCAGRVLRTTAAGHRIVVISGE